MEPIRPALGVGSMGITTALTVFASCLAIQCNLIYLFFVVVDCHAEHGTSHIFHSNGKTTSHIHECPHVCTFLCHPIHYAMFWKMNYGGKTLQSVAQQRNYLSAIQHRAHRHNIRVRRIRRHKTSVGKIQFNIFDTSCRGLCIAGALVPTLTWLQESLWSRPLCVLIFTGFNSTYGFTNKIQKINRK